MGRTSRLKFSGGDVSDCSVPLASAAKEKTKAIANTTCVHDWPPSRCWFIEYNIRSLYMDLTRAAQNVSAPRDLRNYIHNRLPFTILRNVERSAFNIERRLRIDTQKVHDCR